MFSGIIQGIGSLDVVSNDSYKIKTKLDLSDCKSGSSICCNGVCLTATNIEKKDENYFLTVNISEETKLRTNFKNLKKSFDNINIEKSLKIGDEIGGHFVYGHVDFVCKIIEIKDLDYSWEFKFEKKFHDNNIFIVEKGSISINGISLTIANVDKDSFVISIIPHTFHNTNLQFSKVEDFVNVEFDYLARFVLNKND